MTLRRRVVVAVIVAAIIVAAIIYAVFDPTDGFFPRCPLKMATGLDCPGCGSQRAFHALLSGDIAAAWHYNALLFAAVPYLGILAASRQWWRNLYYRLTSATACYIVLAIIALWWILRNTVL